jgi:hypothetical protein
MGVCYGSSVPGKVLFTLNPGLFMFQLGCTKEMAQRGIIAHIIHNHADQDLEGWGLNYTKNNA